MSGTASGDPVLTLRLDGFEGPMELLLELSRQQKVNLARISILALVEQFLEVVAEMRRVRLELAADWLVMAAWLTWLKSRLLIPGDSEAAAEGEAAAEVLTARLAALEVAQRAAAWLAGRSQLGIDAFARGAAERLVVVDRSTLAADLGGLVQAYLAAARRAAGLRQYAPVRVKVWTVGEALARLRRMLGQAPGWTQLDLFLPDVMSDPVQRRAAVASTLLAGLELAKGGVADLRQDAAFGPILLRGVRGG